MPSPPTTLLSSLPPPIPTTIVESESDSVSALPPPSLSINPPRGRPRSSSISNGSPSPVAGTIPLPSIFSNSPGSDHSSSPSTASSGLASQLNASPFGFHNPFPGTSPNSSSAGSGGGWGHRPSLSVPGIVAPSPVAPGGVARGGRHRRTQSVSPPGFPVLAEGEANGFAPGVGGNLGGGGLPPGALPPKMGDAGSSFQARGRRASADSGGRAESPSRAAGGGELPPTSRPINISTVPSRIIIPRSERSPTRSAHSTSTSNSSPRSSHFSPSTSPTSHSLPHSHSHPHHHPSSHAALLSGIRSHALPHSPTLTSTTFIGGTDNLDNSDLNVDPFFDSVLSSPRRPFVTSHSASGTSRMSTSPSSPPFGPTSPKQHHHLSPLALELRNEMHGTGEEGIGAGGGAPFGSVMSPSTNVSSGAQLDLDETMAPGLHPRRTSGGSEDMSPFLDRPGAVSPPLLPLPGPTSPPTMGRPRSRSNASPSESPASLYLEQPGPGEPTASTMPSLFPSSPPLRAISPPLIASTSSPLSPPSLTSISVLSPPSSLLSQSDLFPAPAPPSSSSTDIQPPSLPSDDFAPPPSPHRSTIALPPPLVAPAPLPPHLGGPALLTRRKSQDGRRRGRSAEGRGAGKGDGTVKRHSPLASPALNAEEQDGDEKERGLRSGWDMDEEEEVVVDSTTTEVEKEEGEVVVEREEAVEAEQEEREDLRTGRASEVGDDLSLVRMGRSSAYPPSGPGGGFGALGFSMDVDDDDGSIETDVGMGGTSGGVDDGGLVQRLEESIKMSMVGSRSESESEEEEEEEDSDGEGEDVIAIDEESLSALERIFVCAKSDAPEERARVAFNLADWLLAVDICEAAEYVLPLLGGLATDQDEVVKEVFAPQLDRIMWHFFSQCPLIELDPTPSESGDQSHPSPTNSPVPSRYTPLAPPSEHPLSSASSLLDPSPTSAHFPLPSDSGSTSTPPPTSKTSPSNTEVSDVPRISATTFTSLLGALLTDQSNHVAKSTEAALVRFLCRLKGKPLPEISPDTPALALPGLEDDFAAKAIAAAAAHQQSTTTDDSHHHAPYQLTPEAAQVLEDEFVNGIVLGLARLDEDDRLDPNASANGDNTMDDDDDCSTVAADRRNNNLSSTFSDEGDEPVGTMTNSAFVMSPEEEQIEDGWLASSGVGIGAGSFDGPTIESWAPPPSSNDALSSFFNDSLDRPLGTTTSTTMSGAVGIVGSGTDSSPLEQVYSSFSPEGFGVGSGMGFSGGGGGNGVGDEESAIGKMVSMSLIGAIVAAECLEMDVLVEQILPEVERMKDEPMFYVRKEAMQALSQLARVLPIEVLQSMVIPLHSVFARDTLWHVRRAACLALPSLCKRLPPPVLRVQAVHHIKAFSTDSSRIVRSGALEVCGELTYLFFDDPDGVPDEILAIFLGQATDTSAPAPPPAPIEDNDLFAPLQSALDLEPFYDVPTANSTNTTASNDEWNSSALLLSARDPDRPVMCAFNYPAMVLTLGASRWPQLQPYHLSLCHDKVAKVRQSLASSLHEIAKIIGPEQSDQTLLEPWSLFIKDLDHIQGAVLENCPTLLKSWSVDAGRHALELLNEAWSEIRIWRRREQVVKCLGELGERYMGAGEELLGVLNRAFKDPVAAVRDQAVYVIPHLFRATESNTLARNRLCAFLSVFSEDSSYRNRMTYIASILASIRGGISRDAFETYFLESLSRLARDPVVSVRISVARAVAEACQPASIYPDVDSRQSLHDLLSFLSHSPDRDVRTPILAFYQSESRSPSPTGFDRSGARSRQAFYEDEVSIDAPPPHILTARRTNPGLHGVLDDEDEDVEMDGDDALVRRGAMAGEGEEQYASLDDLPEDEDMNDDSDPIVSVGSEAWEIVAARGDEVEGGY